MTHPLSPGGMEMRMIVCTAVSQLPLMLAYVLSASPGLYILCSWAQSVLEMDELMVKSTLRYPHMREEWGWESKTPIVFDSFL